MSFMCRFSFLQSPRESHSFFRRISRTHPCLNSGPKNSKRSILPNSFQPLVAHLTPSLWVQQSPRPRPLSRLTSRVLWACRTCPTRTDTGTRPVSTARGAGGPLWTSRSLPRRTSCSAPTATRRSTRPAARSARRASCQVGTKPLRECARACECACARFPRPLCPLCLPPAPAEPARARA